MMDFALPPFKAIKPAIILPRPSELIRPSDPRFVIPSGLGAFPLSALSGFGASHAGAAGPATLTYKIADSNNPGSTSVAHNSINVGAGSSDLYVIACIHESKSSGAWAAGPLSSVTIGGVSATLAGTQVINNASVVAIFYANVPAGGSINFTWTTAAQSAISILHVYTATGLVSSAPTATASSIANPMAASLAIPASGFGVGVAAVDGSSSFTWTNLTENADTASGLHAASVASSSSSGTSTRTATPGTYDKGVLSMAAWN